MQPTQAQPTNDPASPLLWGLVKLSVQLSDVHEGVGQEVLL